MNDAMQGVDPRRVELAGRFARRIELHMARGSWELVTQNMRQAFEQLDGLAARRAVDDTTALAEICGAGYPGNLSHDGSHLGVGTSLVRICNALETHLGVLTLGDYLALTYDQVLAVPNIGPRGRDALQRAVIDWLLGGERQHGAVVEAD